MATHGQDLGFTSAPKDEESPDEMCPGTKHRKGMITRNPISHLGASQPCALGWAVGARFESDLEKFQIIFD